MDYQVASVKAGKIENSPFFYIDNEGIRYECRHTELKINFEDKKPKELVGILEIIKEYPLPVK